MKLTKNMLERYLSENFSGIIIDGHDFLTYSIEENINLLKEITIPSVIINGYFDNVDNVNLCYVNNNISSFIENIAKEYIRKEKKKILFLFERMSFGVKIYLQDFIMLTILQVWMQTPISLSCAVICHMLRNISIPL